MKHYRNDLKYRRVSQQLALKNPMKKDDIAVISDVKEEGDVPYECTGSKLQTLSGKMFFQKCSKEGYIPKDARIVKCPRCGRTYGRVL